MTDIFEYLSNNAYPGRGIIIGRYQDKPVIAYFIMGRSANSRNRIFIKKDDVLSTEAYDISKVADPSLIIYNAIREHGNNIIVTNGNQTDTIYEHLNEGKTFRDALETREYEPDVPKYTPRISAIIEEDGYQIAILKKEDDHCLRLFYRYPAVNGIAHFISTYDHDGNPLPSFSGEPAAIEINGSCEEYANRVWNCLNEDNRVSLLCLFTDMENGNRESFIINKHI